ncbi:hypothetical protein D3C80_1071100 [compost metagenome]
MILGLPGGGDRAGAADDPQQGEAQAGTLNRQPSLVEAEARHAAGQHRRQQTGQDDGPQTGLLPRGAETTHDPLGAALEGPHDPVIGARAVEASDHPGPLAGVDARTQQPVGHDAADQGDGAHHQRQVEAVPDRQTVIGDVRPQHRTNGDGQHRPDCDGRQDADQDAQADQNLDGEAHPARRLMRRLGQVDGRRAKEGLVDEAHRIEHAQQTGDGRQNG